MCIRDRRKGVLEHGIPDGLMIDDGEKVRPCRCGGPMNSRGKMVEQLMRDLEAAGAPVEVFNGKSGAEIMDELVKILKMYNSPLKMAKETQRLLPVSYTHLDVYKRQALYCASPSSLAKMPKSSVL